MKKALALILTAAMLFSCLAVGASAARVFETVETSPAKYDKAWTGAGGVALERPAADVGSTFTYEVTIFSEENARDGDKLGEFNPRGDVSPAINMETGKIQVFNLWYGYGAGDTVTYDGFEANKWYTVTFEVEGDSAAVSVNGEYIGDVSCPGHDISSATNMANYNTHIGSVKVTDNGEVAYEITFENDAADGGASYTGGYIAKMEVAPAVTTTVNNNVISSFDSAWTAAGGEALERSAADVGSTFSYEVTIFSEENARDGDKLGEFNPRGDVSPAINMETGKIQMFNLWYGYGAGDTVTYDGFEANKWYTVRFDVEGDSAAVYVNDEYIGDVSCPGHDISSATNMANYNTHIGNVKVTDDDGTVAYEITFEGGAADGGASFSEGYVAKVAAGSTNYDLGLKYLDATDDSYYTWFKSNKNCGIVEFDFAPGAEEMEITAFGDNVVINMTSAGVGGEKVAFASALKVGEWYHIQYVCDGGSTAIYLDGALVGTVAKVIGENALGGFVTKIAIDNLRIGSRFTDFESDDIWANFDKDNTPGGVANYEFEAVEKPDPYLTLGMDKVAEGEAFMVEYSEAGYALINPKGVNVAGNVAYSFDLALIPGDDVETEQTFYEFWRVDGGHRFRIGYDPTNEQFNGFVRDEDMHSEADTTIGFNWGKATPDNFHNVVIAFANRKALVYIDGVKIYEGAAYNPNSSGNSLGGVWGGSAIMDNMVIYNVDDPYAMTVLYEGGLGSEIENMGGYQGDRDWTIGADCSVNGCVYFTHKTTTNETCHTLGVETYYCALCGEGYKTADRAMLEHVYTKYDINRLADGLSYIHCQTSGCDAKHYYTSNTTEAHSGTIYMYLDMGDELATKAWNSTENYFSAFTFDGVASVTETATYGVLSTENLSVNRPTYGDWGLSFDFTYNRFDAEANNGDDRKALKFMFNENLVFFDIAPSEDYIGFKGDGYNGTIASRTSKYDFVEGNTYNITMSFKQGMYEIEEDWEEYMATFFVYINGELVFEYSYDTMEDLAAGLAWNEDKEDDYFSMPIQNFWVDYSLDNFVVGSSDFAWTERTYVGDVDGDNYLTAADALCMRQLLAKVVDGSDFAQDRMDANQDGVINAKDQLTIRKALAA